MSAPTANLVARQSQADSACEFIIGHPSGRLGDDVNVEALFVRLIIVELVGLTGGLLAAMLLKNSNLKK